jgi:hypothetical protein
MPKTKLTDSQLVILNIVAKAERPIGKDDLAGLRAKGAALARVVAVLIKKDLLKESRAKRGEPFWHRNESGHAKALAITSEGLAALGIDPGSEEMEPSTQVKAPSKVAARTPKKPDSTAAPAPRPDTKKARLLELLMTAEGASIDQLTKRFCWQAHTVRAALTGLRKSGYDIERDSADGVSRYRIVGARKAA